MAAVRIDFFNIFFLFKGTGYKSVMAFYAASLRAFELLHQKMGDENIFQRNSIRCRPDMGLDIPASPGMSPGVYWQGGGSGVRCDFKGGERITALPEMKNHTCTWRFHYEHSNT
jgi:hypothetical protein